MNNDLISRSALKAELMKRAVSCPKSHIRAYGSCISALEVSPAVDAEPVQHGTWIYDPNAADWGIGGYVCSKCYAKNNNLPCNEVKNPLMFRGSNFCPHCGTKMYGGTDDERS